jgi:hypothetical protein
MEKSPTGTKGRRGKMSTGTKHRIIKTLTGNNVERKNADLDKTLNNKKNVDWKKHRMEKKVDRGQKVKDKKNAELIILENLKIFYIKNEISFLIQVFYCTVTTGTYETLLTHPEDNSSLNDELGM